jgi:hypothetical protein
MNRENRMVLKASIDQRLCLAAQQPRRRGPSYNARHSHATDESSLRNKAPNPTNSATRVYSLAAFSVPLLPILPCTAAKNSILPNAPAEQLFRHGRPRGKALKKSSVAATMHAISMNSKILEYSRATGDLFRINADQLIEKVTLARS